MPNAEGEAAWSDTEACVRGQGRHHWKAAKKRFVGGRPAAAAAATAAASSVPAVAEIVVAKISETA